MASKSSASLLDGLGAAATTASPARPSPATCDTFTCPAHTVLRGDAHALHCDSLVCTHVDTAECCTDALCSSMPCPAGFIPNAGAAARSCPFTPCRLTTPKSADVPLCCRQACAAFFDAATCSSYDASGVAYAPIGSGATTACGGSRCGSDDLELCCTQTTVPLAATGLPTTQLLEVEWGFLGRLLSRIRGKNNRVVQTVINSAAKVSVTKAASTQISNAEEARQLRLMKDAAINNVDAKNQPVKKDDRDADWFVTTPQGQTLNDLTIFDRGGESAWKDYWLPAKRAERQPSMWTTVQEWPSSFVPNVTVPLPGNGGLPPANLRFDEIKSCKACAEDPRPAPKSQKLAHNNAELKQALKGEGGFKLYYEALLDEQAMAGEGSSGEPLRPVWACGLLANYWGCTPSTGDAADAAVASGEKTSSTTCTVYSVTQGGKKNDARTKGGWYFEDEMTASEYPVDYFKAKWWNDQVDEATVAKSSPAYDMFCDFFPPFPDMSHTNSNLPEVDIFAEPAPRYFHSMDFEPIEEVLVVFGGRDDVPDAPDTDANGGTSGAAAPKKENSVFDDMWLYNLSDSSLTKSGAHWMPVHYISKSEADTAGDRTAYLQFDGTEWVKSTDDQEAQVAGVRPGRRYGHATAMYTTYSKDLHSMGAWYEERKAFIPDAAVDTEMVSFLFLYGGANETSLLNDVWVFQFARDKQRISPQPSYPTFSARYDASLGPYIGWQRLQMSQGASKLVPLVHSQLLYIDDASGVPLGSLYIVGGMQKPLDTTADDLPSWATPLDKSQAGCPDDPKWKQSMGFGLPAATGGNFEFPDADNVCKSEGCCVTVEGVPRDTGGLTNGMWRIKNIFTPNFGGGECEDVPLSGARPPGMMDVSYAVPRQETGHAANLIVFGGALGPSMLNTKFAGGTWTSAGDVWVRTTAPVQLKSPTIWCLNMDELQWEVPPIPDPVLDMTVGQGVLTNYRPWVSGLSLHAGVLRGGFAGKPLTYLVIGGMDMFDDPHNSVWEFTFHTSTWRTVTSGIANEGVANPTRRHSHVVATVLHGNEEKVHPPTPAPSPRPCCQSAQSSAHASAAGLSVRRDRSVWQGAHRLLDADHGWSRQADLAAAHV